MSLSFEDAGRADGASIPVAITRPNKNNFLFFMALTLFDTMRSDDTKQLVFPSQRASERIDLRYVKPRLSGLWREGPSAGRADARQTPTNVLSASSSNITPATFRSGFPPSRSASSRSATKVRSSITPAPSSTSSAPTKCAPSSMPARADPAADILESIKERHG